MRNFFYIALACVLFSCTTEKSKKQEPKQLNLDKLTFTTEPAADWTHLLKRNHGWFGGDGIFALVPSGKETAGAAEKEEALIWFSDSMLGDIVGDSLQPGYKMINNSVGILTGGKPDSTSIAFYWDKDAQGNPASIFKPNTPATGAGEYYWLGDGFVNNARNNNIYLFAYRIKNIPNQPVFGFKEMGNTLIIIPAGERPPFPGKRQIDIPFGLNRPADSAGFFGSAVFVNTAEAGAPDPDGYVYIYGVRGADKQVLVARVKPVDVESFGDWRFRNGSEWVKNVNEATPVADQSSNEMSVSPLGDGRYIMVFQRSGVSPKVAIRLGASPYGPFGPIIDIYDVSSDLRESPNFFPYNAKAHPVLSKPGELLISYNINSFKFFEEIGDFPHLYRPRFIRLKYELDAP
ncbi:DUF4185 domain-containing protein [Nostoc ellipsosporum NOK]|nr:DUF4185 domain-containing protein [Nostoc ellipsosporum NOK]